MENRFIQFRILVKALDYFLWLYIFYLNFSRLNCKFLLFSLKCISLIQKYWFLPNLAASSEEDCSSAVSFGNDSAPAPSVGVACSAEDTLSSGSTPSFDTFSSDTLPGDIFSTVVVSICVSSETASANLAVPTSSGVESAGWVSWASEVVFSAWDVLSSVIKYEKLAPEIHFFLLNYWYCLPSSKDFCFLMLSLTTDLRYGCGMLLTVVTSFSTSSSTLTTASWVTASFRYVHNSKTRSSKFIYLFYKYKFSTIYMF